MEYLPTLFTEESGIFLIIWIDFRSIENHLSSKNSLAISLSASKFLFYSRFCKTNWIIFILYLLLMHIIMFISRGWISHEGFGKKMALCNVLKLDFYFIGNAVSNQSKTKCAYLTLTHCKKKKKINHLLKVSEVIYVSRLFRHSTDNSTFLRH